MATALQISVPDKLMAVLGSKDEVENHLTRTAAGSRKTQSHLPGQRRGTS